MESAITNELQDLIREAMINKESMLALLRDETLLTIVIDVSKVALRYNEDTAAIELQLSEVIETKLHQLKDPKDIRPWLTASANSCCLNLKRDRKRAEFHSGQRVAVEVNGDHKAEQETASNEPAKQESHVLRKKTKAVDRRRSPWVYELRLNSPKTREQELIEEELENEKGLVQKERLQQLQNVMDQFSNDIMKRCSRFESPEEISKETGVSVQTVYRVLKKFERPACVEFGVDPDNPACRLSLKRALYHRPKASEPGDPLTQRPLIELDRP